MLLQRQDRNGNRTIYSYGDMDDDSRRDELIRIDSQGGLRTTVDYAHGYVANVTDFAGRQQQWHITGGLLEQLTSVDPGLGMATPEYHFRYDGDTGLIAEITEPRGHTSSIDRDSAVQRVSHVTNFDGHEWSLTPYLLDGITGQLKQPTTGQAQPPAANGPKLAEPWARYTDTRGNTWHYQTNSSGLLTAHSKPLQPGSSISDVWQWRRDELGQVTRAIQPAGGGGDAGLPMVVTDQQYDDRGNLIKRTYADGTCETWTYDLNQEYVRSYRDRLGRQSSYLRDEYGNILSHTEYGPHNTYSPIRQTDYTYTDRPASLNDLPGGLIVTETVAANSSDAVTTLTQYYESGSAIGLPSEIYYAYGSADLDAAARVALHYDSQRRLQERIDELSRSTHFVYDALDRLHQQIDPAPETADHDAPITTYYYDPVGNITRTTNPRGNTTRYTYDAMNRLSSVTTPPAAGPSDADQRTATTSYLYDGEGNLLAEWDPHENVVSSQYDARNQLTAVTASTTSHDTILAPPVAVSRESSTFYSYDAWGNLRSSVDPLGVPRCINTINSDD